MYQAALQLNGTSRNHHNSPVKYSATDYIEVVSAIIISTAISQKKFSELMALQSTVIELSDRPDGCSPEKNCCRE